MTGNDRSVKLLLNKLSLEVSKISSKIGKIIRKRLLNIVKKKYKI